MIFYSSKVVFVSFSEDRRQSHRYDLSQNFPNPQICLKKHFQNHNKHQFYVPNVLVCKISVEKRNEPTHQLNRVFVL
jgi:hypothetical protein